MTDKSSKIDPRFHSQVRKDLWALKNAQAEADMLRECVTSLFGRNPYGKEA